MKHEHGAWFDEEAGPLIRPFAMTRGRAGASGPQLDMISLVIAVRPESDGVPLEREYADILRICQHGPLSIAEISAKLGLLLAVVKVLVADLLDERYLALASLPPMAADEPDLDLLRAVLDGVRKL
jgi:hypothetical protein